MAVLPDRMQVPSAPFSNIGVDLIGSIAVKAMTNKRSTLKVWVAIFVCRVRRLCPWSFHLVLPQLISSLCTFLTLASVESL